MLTMDIIHRLAGRLAPAVFCLDAVGELGRQLQKEGVPVICLDRRPGRDWGVAGRLARAARAQRIEVLHAHQYTPFFYAALAKVLAGTAPRLILTEHGRHDPDPIKPLRRAVNRLVLDPLADAVTAVSAFSADRLRKVDGFAGRRLLVIENGIDLARYDPVSDRAGLRRRLGLAPERRYVVHVARCHPVKDQATLLDAFCEVASARAEVDLLLAGDGPLRPELEAQAGRLGIAGRVQFLGVRRDVPDLLRAADVFVLTSRSEAASLTLLEAMAVGLPVVVTNVGGNPEMVRDGQEGLLVPRGDRPAIAAAVLRLLDEPAEAARLGRAGADRVRRVYRIERTVERYFDLYRSLVPRVGR
jgi:glycosyltransferase involved in cell wall biosynthesis